LVVVTRAPAPATPDLPWWRGALAGLLGAGAALVVLDVVALFDATGTSVAEAVQNRFIESFAASLKDVAVQLFGTNDKTALAVGTIVVTLLVGAAFGAQVRRLPGVTAAGFLAFGAFGIWAASSDPLASTALGAVGCVLAVAAGLAVTFLLAAHWADPLGLDPDPAPAPAAEPEPAPEPERERVDRRTVLVNAGIVGGVLLVGGALARSTRDSLRAGARAVSRALPRPTRRTPVPSGTLDGAGIDGLSSYLTPTRDFYRIDTAYQVPVVDADRWRLRITGKVDRELTFTYDELLARDLVEVPITIQCVSNEVGGDLIGTARWIGVPLAELLREAGVHPDADQVIGESVDGFTAGFPTEVALDGRDALVALGMGGRTLPGAHGYPARLIVPGLYGYVSATKWLAEIRLTRFADEDGFWVPRGWSRLGPIKTQSRIDVPGDGADLAAGAQPIAGVAWAPHRGIERVEVRVDDGPWQRAELGRVASADTWVQWRLRWDATPGDHTIEVRATDGDGHVQTARRSRPDPDGATGHHTIEVSVSG
jgi:DMSO/TMAO reductase YedYZ molybdopterin-dependent catalytic subunit